MTFTQTFGGTTIYPAGVSYRAVALSANQTLTWPVETATSNNIVAQIMDVTPSAGSLSIIMPPANEVSVGETTLFFNPGAFSFTVKDNGGNTIVAIAPGLSYQVYLIGNSTVNGTWRSTQYAAGTSVATAGSLVGSGIKAISSTLNQSMSVTTLNSNYTIGDADRSEAFVWNGGAGAFTLPSSGTVGNDWFCQIRNSGTGAITLTPTGSELINGAPNLTFNPGDSAIVICDGSAFFTIGFGQSAAFAFDYVSIDLSSPVTSPYTLSGANLNRIAYSFGGTLTANMEVLIPATIQQYWISNDTSGAFSLTVKVSGQTGVVIPQGSRGIYYCNGTDIIDADTASFAFPLTVAQGGTGATTESGARVNLGGTSVGIGVFTAVTAADGRNALIAAKSGANSDITSLTGLTTPLSVPQGGTGVATLTANGVVLGNGASALAVTAVGTTGQVLVGNTGAAPTWSTLSGIGVTSFSAGTTGLTPSTATTGVVTLAGTLGVANGGTGTATAFTAGSVVFAGASGVYSQDNANLFWDDTNDRLGIGTATPGTILETASDTDGSIRSGSYVSSAVGGSFQGRKARGSKASPSAVTTDDTLVSLIGAGYTSGSAFSGNVGAIAITAAEAFTATANGTNITISTTAIGATARSEAVRITSAGDVGIGTASPSAKLDVIGIASARTDASTGNSPLVAVNTNSGNNTTKYTSLLLQGYDTVGTGKNTGLVLAGPSDANYVTSYMAFHTRSADALSERIRITSGGDVGINTSAPTARLHVFGNNGTFGTNSFFGLNGSTSGIAIGNNGTIGLIQGQATATSSTAADIGIQVNGGNVGIGTSSPGTKLDVSSSAANIVASRSTTSFAAFQRFAPTGQQAYDFYTINGVEAGRITVDGSNFMAFATGSAAAERMRIDSSGNVGIGTSSPTAALSIARGAGLSAEISLRGGNVAAAAEFYIAQVQDGFTTYLYNRANGPMIFGTNNSERARIDSSGNVMVNTTTAIEKLTIGSTTATSSGINQRTTQTDFAIKPSNTAAGGVTLEVGWVAGGQGPLIFNLGGEKARIDSSGNLLVGTTSASCGGSTMRQHIDATDFCLGLTTAASGNTQAVRFAYGATAVGSITLTGSTTTYNTSSDYRLKDINGPIANSGAYIDALNPVQGSWKADGSRFIGLLAHEVQEVSETPIATGEKDGEEMQAMDYSAPELIANLIAEIQSLRARVAQLEGN